MLFRRIQEFLRPSTNASLMGSAVLILTTKVLGFGFAILLPLLLARRLTQQEFGIYKQSFLVVSTTLAVLAWSLAMSVFYFLPREPDRRNSVVCNVLALQSTAGLLLFAALALFPDMTRWISRDGALVPYSRLIGLVIALWMAGSGLDTILLANHDTRLYSLISVSLQVSKAGLLWVAGLVWGTVESLLTAAAGHGLVQVICAYCYLSRRFPGFLTALDVKLLTRQLSYSAPMALSGVLLNLQFELHNYFISYAFGAATFAIYSVGVFQLPLMNMLAESTTAVLMPRVSTLAQADDREGIIELTMRAFRKLQLVAFGLYGYLLVVREEFLLLIYTDQYRASVPIFTINLAMLLLTSYMLLDPTLRAYPRYRFLLVLNRAVLAAGQVLLLRFLIARWGLPGAAVTVVVVTILDQLMSLVLCGWILRLRWRHLSWLRDPAKTALCALGATLMTALSHEALAGQSRWWILSLCAVVFGVFYGGLLLIWRVFSPEELRLAARLPLVRSLPGVGKWRTQS